MEWQNSMKGVLIMEKFLCKAKRIDTKEWVEGAFLPKTHEIVVNTLDCPAMYAPDEKINGYIYYYYKVDIETICQCTGIKDKNGTLIFENDICKYYNPEDKDGIGVIRDGFVWWKGGTIAKKETITPLVYLRYGQEWEVIGNMFDNEEILEKYR